VVDCVQVLSANLKNSSYRGGTYQFPVDSSWCSVLSAIMSQLFSLHSYLKICGQQDLSSALKTDNYHLVPLEGCTGCVQTLFCYDVVHHMNKFPDIRYCVCLFGRVGCVTMTMIVVMDLMRGSFATPSIRPAVLQSLPARTSSVSECHTGVMVKMTAVITPMKSVVPVSTSWLSE
jgi:hypothetical protein